MSRAPLRWTAEELENAANLSAERFRSDRLLASGAWAAHYAESRNKFEMLFAKLGDLAPGEVTAERLADVFGAQLFDALRYLAGPPISEDDLQIIADVDSISAGVLSGNPDQAEKVFRVIERVIDPYRFPWVHADETATGEQRESALTSSAVLLAAQRIATERRSHGKNSQEAEVRQFLRELGFAEVSTETITTIVKGPQRGQYCAECKLGDRKADIVVRLHDTRLMAIECKVSNSAVNSVKRLNNDAAVKAKYWIEQFGSAQIVPVAVLAGVFKVHNLEQAQQMGLTLFWSHALHELGRFIRSTG